MGKLEVALASVGEEARNAFLAHLEAGTSATWLADWLTRAGHPVGPTTVKDFRKKVRNGSGR